MTQPQQQETSTRKWRVTLYSVRAHPTSRLAKKIIIAVLGGLVVAVGLVLIPLPGPGWLIVLAGLGIWAIEFVWARHLLQFTRNKLRGWTTWIGLRSLPVRLLIGLLGLLFVAGVAVLTIRYSLGVNILADGWRYVTTH
jgi:uncharacterized protein (TIGR02611 family)